MEQKKSFIIRVVYYAVIALIVYAVCKYLLPALMPFLVAFVVAMLIRWPTVRLSKENVKRQKILAILFSALFYGIVFLAVILMGAKLVQSLVDLAVSAPTLYRDQIVPLLNEFSDWVSLKLSSVDAEASAEIDDFLTQVSNNMGQSVSEISVTVVKAVSGSVTGIPSLVVNIVITVVATFFMAADYPQLREFILKLLPQRAAERADRAVAYLKNLALIYSRSYLLLFLLTFSELTIGLLILRIPYAVLVALGIAVFDILPVLGTGGILLPWAVILFAMGKVPLGIGIVILYLVITVIRNTVEPRLVGKQIGLHPLATLIALYVGLKLIGFAGVIIFPVALAIFVQVRKDNTTEQDPSENE